MNKIALVISGVFLLGVLFLLFLLSSSPKQEQTQPQKKENAPKTQVIATNLDTPWGLAFLPNGELLVTERQGNVKRIDQNGNVATVATLSKVQEIGEGGLLGIALHPDFSKNNFVYFYYTYSAAGNDTLNRVVRLTYKNNQLSNEQIIVDAIPGASNHNGGRIKFGPDKNLYITTGDAQNPSLSQDKNSLAGKILRVTDEGKPVPGNPFNNLVYSYGHRNPQGIAWDSKGRMWEVEHGQSATDELNSIEMGKNYGWPEIQGDEEKVGMVKPRVHSGANTTWAPSGAAIVNDKLYFAGLRGQSLYQVSLNSDRIYKMEQPLEVKSLLQGEFGRLRDVVLGPDNMLYITTSNRDGRGSPAEDDDKIIKVNPKLLQ
ncbi:MAG: PQQ-dependent sugar dehydrogenase [Candidatus Levybacteria bacterium]|nr:PQQ-dependent sugar dehydrogenase [Candidatus Levybacteria bacterium]